MPERFPVELSAVMTFARALGDSDQLHLAAAATTEHEPLAVPLTFTQTVAQWNPGYWLRPRPGSPWHGSGQGPGMALEGSGTLHAEQHFTYHRPVLVGDVLTRTERAGETWVKVGRSGRLTFAETISEFRDDTGHLVVTARAVSVVTTRDSDATTRDDR